MSSKNTFEFFNSLLGRRVQIGDGVPAVSDCYAESGMRARVRSVKLHDEERDCPYVAIVLDYEPYEDFNRAYEQANYYDGDGVARLTAREANMYERRETIYLTLNGREDYLYPLEGELNALSKAYYESGTDKKTYVEWLEGLAAAHLEMTTNTGAFAEEHKKSSGGMSYTRWLEDELDSARGRADDISHALMGLSCQE